MDNDYIDYLCRKVYGTDDESLINEYEKTKAQLDTLPLQAPEDEFNVIMAKINKRKLKPDNKGKKISKHIKNTGKLILIVAILSALIFAFGAGANAQYKYTYALSSTLTAYT